MAIINGSFKLLATSFGVGSVLMIKGIVGDVNLYSQKFMDDKEIQPTFTQKKVVSVEALNDIKRENNSPKIQYFGMSKENMAKLGGSWEITVITESVHGKDEIIYNKFQNSSDRKKVIKVDFEQIGTSLVKLDNDPESVYRISYLTEHNTIALFKEIDGGFEIIEGKKLLETKKVLRPLRRVIAETGSNSDSSRNDVTLEDQENGDFYLMDAIDPVRSSTRPTAMKDEVSGSVTISEQSISSLSVVLHKGKSIETSISISEININDGGQITADYEGETISGIISSNGKGAKTIRFATGPLQGATLNFVSQEKWDLVEEQQEAARLAREESEESNIAREVAAISKRNERVRVEKNENEEDDSEITEEELEEIEEIDTEEEIATKFEESGFSFAGEAVQIAKK